MNAEPLATQVACADCADCAERPAVAGTRCRHCWNRRFRARLGIPARVVNIHHDPDREFRRVDLEEGRPCIAGCGRPRYVAPYGTSIARYCRECMAARARARYWERRNER